MNLKSKWVKESTSIVLHGGGRSDLYDLDLIDAERLKLPKITLNNLDINKAKDKLRLMIKDYRQIKLGRDGNNLDIVCDSNVVALQNVFSDNTKKPNDDYTHLDIEFIDQEKNVRLFNTNALVNRWEELNTTNHNQLSGRLISLSDYFGGSQTTFNDSYSSVPSIDTSGS